MKIGFTLNEVLRDYIGQLNYVCDKYLGTDEIEGNNFDEIWSDLGFKNKDDFNKFIYEEHPLEVLGHNDLMAEHLMVRFNEFLANLDPDEHTVVIMSREVGGGIPATLFFLSKTICKAKNILFVEKFEDKWDHCDILITANPKVLTNKPSNKISVKVMAPYNKDVESDYTITSLTEFLKSEELQDKILK